MTESTLVRCDLDFNADGKQSGYLAVPISTNESAYGILTVPIHVFRNGEGPTMSFTGGVHGDEYEGPVTLMKLARSLQPEEIKGRVIIIPTLNLPAVMSGDRCSPLDGLNLNRVFPGRANGSVTETIAHYITTHIVPESDCHLDLHSGGRTLEYIPSIFVPPGKDDDARKYNLEMALAFGTDLAIVEDRGFPDAGRFLSAEFTRAGINTYTSELGGAGRVSPHVVRLAEHGVRNVMKVRGVLGGEPVTPESQGRAATRVVTVPGSDSYVMAPDNGLYEPFCDLGDSVTAGMPLGQVHYPQHHDKSPCPVLAPHDGMMICKRPPGRVVRGDNIHIIAQQV